MKGSAWKHFMTLDGLWDKVVRWSHKFVKHRTPPPYHRRDAAATWSHSRSASHRAQSDYGSTSTAVTAAGSEPSVCPSATSSAAFHVVSFSSSFFHFRRQSPPDGGCLCSSSSSSSSSQLLFLLESSFNHNLTGGSLRSHSCFMWSQWFLTTFEGGLAARRCIYSRTKWVRFAYCDAPKLNFFLKSFLNTESSNTHIQLFRMSIGKSQAWRGF